MKRYVSESQEKWLRSLRLFSELEPKAQKKAEKEEKEFCSAFGFKRDKLEGNDQLYFPDGRIAKMSSSERKKWYGI
ncbi:MAG: hypothetical protein U9P79_09480 [Candidatus Cloacimonadota bacterium]|nr:hypothetical protein [Candidatus Cloacimonadota bacterium]